MSKIVSENINEVKNLFPKKYEFPLFIELIDGDYFFSEDKDDFPDYFWYIGQGSDVIYNSQDQKIARGIKTLEQAKNAILDDWKKIHEGVFPLKRSNKKLYVGDYVEIINNKIKGRVVDVWDVPNKSGVYFTMCKVEYEYTDGYHCVTNLYSTMVKKIEEPIKENYFPLKNKYKVFFYDDYDNEIASKESFNTYEDADDWAQSHAYDYNDIIIDDDGNDRWETFYRYSYNGETWLNYEIRKVTSIKENLYPIPITTLFVVQTTIGNQRDIIGVYNTIEKAEIAAKKAQAYWKYNFAWKEMPDIIEVKLNDYPDRFVKESINEVKNFMPLHNKRFYILYDVDYYENSRTQPIVGVYSSEENAIKALNIIENEYGDSSSILISQLIIDDFNF